MNFFLLIILLILKVPPRWRIEPIDTSVVKGRNAIIDCDTDAYPPPIISWSRAEGRDKNSLFYDNIEKIFSKSRFRSDNNNYKKVSFRETKGSLLCVTENKNEIPISIEKTSTKLSEYFFDHHLMICYYYVSSSLLYL